MLARAARIRLRAAAAAVLLAAPALVFAQSTPVGAWRTVDDKTGKPRGIVRIYEENGQLFARIDASLNPQNPGHVCDKCKDDRKGKPIVGMVIVRGMRKLGDEYGGGDILDPDSGTVYRCKMRLLENGKKLLVRGYIGISLLGRSQTWIREP